MVAADGAPVEGDSPRGGVCAGRGRRVPLHKPRSEGARRQREADERFERGRGEWALRCSYTRLKKRVQMSG